MATEKVDCEIEFNCSPITEISTPTQNEVLEVQENASGCDLCPVSITKCILLFQNDEDVDHFVHHHNLIQKRVKCPTCSNDARKTSGQWRCQRTTTIQNRKVKCSFKKTVLGHSMFEATKLPRRKALHFFTWYLLLSSRRQETVMREAEVSANTYCNWAKFCREVFLEHCEKHAEMLGGVGKVVEIDEAKFGKRKYNVGRKIQGQWVFGGVERGSKKCFLVPVPDRSANTLLNVIKQYILPGTTIMSDCWKAYNCLSEEGYQHFTVNHSCNFVDPETGAYTQNVERIWRDCKRALPPFGRNLNNFEEYMAEFMFMRKFPNFKDRMHAFYDTCSKMFQSNQLMVLPEED